MIWEIVHIYIYSKNDTHFFTLREFQLLNGMEFFSFTIMKAFFALI